MNEQPDNPSPKPISANPILPVCLSAWDWHHLLKEIETGILCVVNRDQTNARILYAKIATQLAGYEVVMPPQKRPDPIESSKTEPSVEDASLWKRIFG